jgi:uncharacterized protein (TIGR00369 family)
MSSWAKCVATAHESIDPGYEARIRDSFGRQTFMASIGAELIRVEPGHVEIELPYRPDLCQQHGFFHGGVTSAIADTAGGYAGFSLFPPESAPLTVEFKINLLAPARGEKLVAVAEVIKSGRTLTISDLKVFAVANGERTLCAAGLQTLMCLQGRPDDVKPP